KHSGLFSLFQDSNSTSTFPYFTKARMKSHLRLSNISFFLKSSTMLLNISQSLDEDFLIPSS
ncbi:MAG: hypothetical protein CMB97_07025, partial [Flavobacteriaceae bacterium]|nr:hypothetical protein [Flavobacteriaceae bacterium]